MLALLHMVEPSFWRTTATAVKPCIHTGQGYVLPNKRLCALHHRLNLPYDSSHRTHCQLLQLGPALHESIQTHCSCQARPDQGSCSLNMSFINDLLTAKAQQKLPRLLLSLPATDAAVFPLGVAQPQTSSLPPSLPLHDRGVQLNEDGGDGLGLVPVVHKVGRHPAGRSASRSVVVLVGGRGLPAGSCRAW